MGRYVRGEETWIAVDGSDESSRLQPGYKRRLQLVTTSNSSVLYKRLEGFKEKKSWVTSKVTSDQ